MHEAEFCLLYNLFNSYKNAQDRKMNFKAIALASLAALVAAAPTNEQPVNETAPVSKRSDDTYNNIATWYNAETGNRGACGDWLSNNDRFVAVSYDNPIPCGQWVVSGKYVAL